MELDIRKYVVRTFEFLGIVNSIIRMLENRKLEMGNSEIQSSKKMGNWKLRTCRPINNFGIWGNQWAGDGRTNWDDAGGGNQRQGGESIARPLEIK